MKDATSLILQAFERVTFHGRRIIHQLAKQSVVSCRVEGGMLYNSTKLAVVEIIIGSMVLVCRCAFC
jgi:hypothetical protein